MAHESILFSDCEGHRTLTERHGTLHSPNYPCSYGSYRGGQDCRWVIEPQINSNSVKAIWIKFHTFYLDWPTNYCWLGSCIYFQFRSPHLSVLYKPDDLSLRTEVIRSTPVGELSGCSFFRVRLCHLLVSPILFLSHDHIF